jgi:hypothetical protein
MEGPKYDNKKIVDSFGKWLDDRVEMLDDTESTETDNSPDKNIQLVETYRIKNRFNKTKQENRILVQEEVK